METTLATVRFSYPEDDRRLFTDDQKRHWQNIESMYPKLRARCLPSIQLPQSGAHNKWVAARVNLHATSSVMRLLYLTESFVDACLKFNSVTVATHVKAMVEIPMHLGYLVWILDTHSDFQEIRKELANIAWGERDARTGLTFRAKISQKVFYSRADEMIRKFFPEGQNINIFETIYKEANAIGHHNHESRNMLVGLMPHDTWQPKDRKEWFVFWSNNIFQFFLHCDAILGESHMFLNAIDHYLGQMPEQQGASQ